VEEQGVKKLLLILALMGLAVLPGLAATYPLGIGAYGGYDYPVIQEDVGAGPMWAFGVRGNIWKLFHGQLIVRGTSQADVEEDIDFPNEPTLTIPGGTLTGFGFNLLLAAKNPVNFWPYGLLGVSSNSLAPGASYKEDESLTGWSFGGGFAINLYNRALYLDLNTSLLVMPFHDDKASRKNWQTLAGFQYFIPIKTK
jgi:hypothetical protein